MQKRIKKVGKSLLPHTVSFSHKEPVYIPLFFADPTKKRQIVWELAFEDGSRDSGKIKRNAFQLPSGLPTGKHQLSIIVGQPFLEKGVKIHICELIINP